MNEENVRQKFPVRNTGWAGSTTSGRPGGCFDAGARIGRMDAPEKGGRS